ncbi:DNA recombination protein RmuC [Alcaligenaceae bacterium A4P071]|nr:DNA recombination protein RmuC [Alcaligenaceae bacterium B3P038]MDQ2151668.1 DNA recombination protein RmuC [Alcaligenaceae bacterium C4P045]MDQ2187340.1 DNA recombination protein RmuC [Alcaligenaceae bacterium A4P071]
MTDVQWLWVVVATTGVTFICVLLGLSAAARRHALVSAQLTALTEAQARAERDARGDLHDVADAMGRDAREAERQLRDELHRHISELRGAVSRDAQAGRTESAESLQRFAAQLSEQVQKLVETNDRRMAEIRQTVDQRLQALQTDNTAKLEEMRRTVDEKLHATLEQRLGESFKLVSDRLEAVHKGLGEMQTLAAGVGDLKRVLTNVKSRGTWGEVQLARLIEDTMTPAQYARNVKTVPGSDAQVEFAIKLPGQGGDAMPVWLPIDAKFPKEEYERLVAAQDAADLDAIQTASVALGRALELQARTIAAKYIAPPHTTDFAILFVPTEGLYAEILRVPGLLDRLHGLRINVAGPSTLAALLNSLQMGFRTLAIEQRSSEVWQVLRAVKTEFGKFGESLASVKKSLESASNKLGSTEVRTRAMLRNLKSVEALPEAQPQALPEGDLPEATEKRDAHGDLLDA